MSYEPNKYFEYFVIDEGYYPEINESSIKDPKNKWQSTFPHRDIVALLKLLERALSRSDKKSLWLEGSYGTGKSRILWMLENLLTCSENDFDAYFDEYDNLRGETDLRERLRTIRGGKVVTATRYATGDITSTQKLIFAVYDSLTDALKKGGCKFDGAKTLRGKIASWLETDKANLELFRAKIQKPDYRMAATLAGRSAEEILERLKNPQAEVSQLVEEILQLGEREGIRAFNINMRELTEWIEEVIAENKLAAVVLFWDEFSKFFGNNRNNLDEFQRLAELSNIAPFYLVIATHESDSLAGGGETAFKTLSDRFAHINITMPDNIALELIGHAVKVRDVAKREWGYISAALRERTAKPRAVVIDYAKIRNEKILTDILPIHPITAILLKNLASYFASNQRSIFNFIKNNDPNVEAFQDFIATKSPENGDLLTIDYLWNFFYESGTDEHGGNNVGRMNLKLSIRAILDTYPLNKDVLSLDECAVLKTILLFQAIDQEAGGQVEIFRPTEDNLELAFTGVAEMENGRAVTIANNLVRKDILFKKPGKVETFAAMALGGDFAEIERLKKTVADTVRTADLVESGKLIETINLTAAQRARCLMYPVAADNFTSTINKITNNKEDYRVKTVVCFARNEDEQNKIYNLISDALRKERYHRLIFIDASSNSISRDIFTRWVENSANEKYWRGKDSGLADKMKDNAADCLKEWYNSFESGSFVYYPATKTADEPRRGISCQSADRISDAIKDNIRRLYPCSFDDAKITNTLFQQSQFKKLAEAGINRQEYLMLKLDSIKIVLGDVWQMSGKYWEVYPDLIISRLKIEVDALIARELEKNVRVSFDEIFAYLVERGFMPLNIYAFLTGFLLKEYAGDPYRFSAGIDGNFGGAMTVQKLAEFIGETIKQANLPARSYHPKYLETMSANQRQFMLFAAEVFGVTEDISVERSAQKLRLKLKDLGYPLWCYVDAAADNYKDFLQLIAEIANSKQAVSVSALAEQAEQAGQFLLNNPATFDDLKIFLTAQNGRDIFTEFLKNFEGGIIFELAQKIGIEQPVAECRRRITSGDGIWLHDKETAADDLKKLIVDYKIIAESRKFNVSGKSFKECVNSWVYYCRINLKVPADAPGEYYSLKDFFSILREMAERGEMPRNKREFFLQQITANAANIHKAFSEPLNVLREKYYQLSGLNDEELKEIHGSLPNSSFTDSQGRYHKNVDDLVKRLQKTQLKNQLLILWREVAGNDFPREWSKVHRTPILAMVPPSEHDNAKKVFEVVTANAPDENSIKAAIDYLEKRPPYFAAIKAARDVEAAFTKAIVEENCALLSNDEVRNELELKCQRDPYQWYPNVRVKNLVKKFAENKYFSGGAYDKVTERVMRMSDGDAKALLIKLLEKNYEVGIKLLREP